MLVMLTFRLSKSSMDAIPLESNLLCLIATLAVIGRFLKLCVKNSTYYYEVLIGGCVIGKALIGES
jgi:hypothetical protein